MCNKADLDPILEQIKDVFTDKKEAILSIMNSMGLGTIFNPVQIQKILFLLDKNAEKNEKAILFSFTPYKYGPFDQGVYQVLEELSSEGCVEMIPGRAYERYLLIEKGLEEAKKITPLDHSSNAGLVELVKWVMSHSFIELINAIYAKYPYTRDKSVIV